MTKPNSNFIPAFPSGTDELKSGEIKFDDAVKDITALLSNQTLGELATAFIGGSIPIEQFFDGTDTNSGVLLWYCFNNESARPFNRFFLSLQRANINALQSSEIGMTQKLAAPTHIFRYEGEKNEAGVAAYLRRDPSLVTYATSLVEIASQDAVLLNTKFNDMQRIGLNSRFNSKTWAYFQNNKEKPEDQDGLITRLVNTPDARYIHYYFGYDETYAPTNKIRIILMAADAYNRNLDSLVVQRSIPPGNS